MNYLLLDIECVPAFAEDDPFIKKWVKKGGKTLDEKMSFDIDLCKIVAIGMSARNAQDAIKTLFAWQEDELLKFFWDNLRGYGRIRPKLVTFNGKNYDLPILIRRTQLQGMGNYIPNNIDDYLNLYKTDYHIDLYQTLRISERLTKYTPKSLEFYAELFGCKSEKFGDGSQIYEWYKKDDWDSIRKHLQSDMDLLVELHQKLGG